MDNHISFQQFPKIQICRHSVYPQEYNTMSLSFYLGFMAFFQICLPQMSRRYAMRHWPRQRRARPKAEVSSSLQVGSWLTPATNLPKAPPLDSTKRSALRFSLFQKAERHEEKRQWENTISVQAHRAAIGWRG